MAGKREEQLKEITERLEQGVTELFTSERYTDYLKTMSQFHNYSFNNTLLIAMHKPDATLVAGYQAWQKKFNRHVLKGERGIQIISPAPIREKEEVEKIDPVTQEPVLKANGQPETEVVELVIPRFKVATVFDVAQTDGEPLPSLGADELTGAVENYEQFMEAIRAVSPVPMRFAEIEGEGHGYYHNIDKEIVIRQGMSESQNMKTAIHEVAHAKLHDRELMQNLGVEKDRMTKEVEAESIAYSVCQHFGLDTGDYSFPYIAGWSSGKDMKELKISMDTIRHTAGEFIEEMTEKLQELSQEVTQEQEGNIEMAEQTEEQGVQQFVAGENISDTFQIYQLKDIEENHGITFMGKDFLDEQNIVVNQDNYDLLYSGTLEEGMSLEDIYTKFNLDRPEDFRGHSLSVSDVVVLNHGGEATAHYVDSFGFTDLPEFFQEKVAEEQISAPAQVPSLAERISDYDSIKDNIYIQLIPKEGNEDLLEQAVHRDMEDMAVIYKIALRETEDGLLSGTLKNSLMEEYGITEEQLYQNALVTTERRYPVQLLDMAEQIRRIMPGIEIEEIEPASYIASNTTMTHGAAVILYPNFMEQVAEQLQGSFYILPSSQHEVILLTDRGDANVEELTSMVMEVNQSDAVGPDKLSDVVLHYDAHNKVLERATDFNVIDVEENLQQEALREPTELAYEVGDRYLLIHETDEGYDYTFYGKNYLEIDGGVYDNPEVSIREALVDILDGEGFLLEDCTELDYEDMDAEVELAGEEHFKQVQLETNCPDSIFEEYENLKDTTEYGGAAMEIGNLYLTVQPVEEGYDFIFYDGELNEINGNVYEDPTISIQEATRKIIDREGMADIPCAPMNYKEFEAMTLKHSRDQLAVEVTPTSQIGRREAALKGQSRAEIEELVLNYAQSQLEAVGLEEEVDIIGARVFGSRTREGLYKTDSDIDVVLSYISHLPEDSFFNMLHEDGLSVAGMPVDINPISVEESGTLEEYLFRADQYLDEKEQAQKEPVGRTTYANGEQFMFYDKESFLHEIDEEIEHRNTSGFRYTVLTDNPELRKAVDDRVYNLMGEENPNDLAHYQETQGTVSEEKEALRLAIMMDSLSEELDPYEYSDSVEDREAQIQSIQEDLLAGGEKTEEMKKWFQEFADDEQCAAQVKEVLEKMDAFEAKVEAHQVEVEPVVTEKEPSISFYVAECMEYPILGIYQDNLTMEEALEIYEQIPAEHMNGIKGIGFRLDDGGIYDGDYELMAAGKMDIDMINCIDHYKNSTLVQEAIVKMQSYLDSQQEKEPVHMETEEISKKQEPVKYEQHEEPAGKTVEATSKPEPVQTQIKPPETKKEQAGGKKESVLQALRERQAKIKAQEQEKSKDKTQAHKKGDVEL